jgi:hypothetical protein
MLATDAKEHDPLAYTHDFTPWSIKLGRVVSTIVPAAHAGILIPKYLIATSTEILIAINLR